MAGAREVSGTLGLLGSMYLCKPTREAIAGWRSLLDEAVPPSIVGLREALGAIDPDSEREMEDLLWDFTRLFIGPGRLPCPPWESVYTSPKKLLMQEAYDAVSEFYQELGLSVGDPNVLQDHVGAELSFLAVLFGKVEEEPERAAFYRQAAERFVAEHARRWIPAFAADLERASETKFYAALARSTRNVVASL